MKLLTRSDRDLVCACLAGHHSAWDSLVHRYKRLIYSLPVECGLSEEDARDVYQTVCVKLFENLERLRDRERLAGWLVATAARESWRIQRERRRYVPLPDADPEKVDESAEDALLDTDSMPHEVIARLEDAELVRQALQELGGRCRKLLDLLYQTEPRPSYAEVARLLGIPEGSIGPTRARCFQRLREILERKGF